MQPDRLAYSVESAAAAIDSSRTVVYEQMQAGNLPFRKLGRRTLIMRADLEKLLDALPVLNGRNNESDPRAA